MRLPTLHTLVLAAVALAPAVQAQAPAFAAPVQNPFGLARFGAGVRSLPVIADLDADGDADIVSGDFNGGLGYYQNTAGRNAAPVFLAPVPLPFGYADPQRFNSTSPAVADFDGDGDLDLLVIYDDGVFYYSRNTAGAGARAAFAAPVVAPFGLPNAGQFAVVSAGDIDRDGDVDLLVGNNTGNLILYRNTAGAGAAPAFGAPLTNPFGLAAIANVSLPAIADFDGDGDADVIAAGRTAFFYHENTAGPNATPVFLAAVTNPFGLAPTSSNPAPTLGDLDTDGDLDLVAGESIGNFYYFQNTRPVAAEPGATASLALGTPAPNPAADHAMLTLRLPEAQRVTVELLDALGRTVRTERLEAEVGETRLRVDVAGLAPGVYVVRVRSAAVALRQRLVVTR